MKSLKTFSDEDIKLLQGVLDAVRSGRLNIPVRNPADRGLDEAQDHLAPEVYLALPDEDTGIPGMEMAGTTPAAGDTPGKAECSMFRIGNTGDLEPIFNSVRDVYNISESAIPKQWTIVLRSKGRHWLAVVGGGGGGEFVFVIISANCIEKSALVRVTYVPCGSSDPAIDDEITVFDVACFLTGNETLLVGRIGFGEKADGDFSEYAEAEEGCNFIITNLCPLIESCS